MIGPGPSWLYRRHGGSPYLLAALVVGAALAITWGLKQLFPATPNALYFCAIIVSAWMGGIGPGIFASALACAAIRITPHVTTDMEAPRYITFMLVGVFTSWLIERQRSTQVALQQAREELEEKVCERTGELTATNEGLKSEIASRKRTEALLDGQKRVLEMMAGGASLTESLDALVRLIERHAPEMLGSILLMDGGGHLRHGAAPSLPAGYVKAIDGAAIGPEAGSCGTAAYRKEAVYAEDIATNPLWKNYREVALQHGLHACWSTPIFDPEHGVLGTFAMYYRRPGLPAVEDLHLIEIATHIAALAICREKAQTTLRESEAKLKEAQRIANIGYWERDLIADRITWSEETCRIFGLQPHDGGLCQATLQELIHPEDRQLQRQALADALEGKRLYDVEYRIVQPKGEVRFVHVRDEIEYDESGRPIRMFGTVQDITDRKRAEDALCRSEQRLQSLVETAPIAIIYCDAEGLLESYNPKAVELWGRTPAIHDLKDRYCGSLRLYYTDGTPMPHNANPVATVLRSEKTELNQELIIERPDGTKVFALSSVAPLKDAQGRVTGAVACIVDITERKRAEEAVRESHQLLNLVLATLPVGVAVTDRAGDIVLANTVSRRIWGEIIISGDERRAQSKGFWHDSGKRIEPENWASVRALTGGQTTLNELIDIETFDGQQKIIQNSSAPIRKAEGLIVGAVIVNEDVTERVRAEEGLRQAQAELTRVVRLTTMGELTASIAHEVNQPLAAVVTNANASLRWLAATPPNLNEVREAVLRIIRDGTRAGDVITRIRTLMKKGEPIRTPLDLNELIRETVALTQPEFARRKVSLQTELAPGLPGVNADRVQLQQVMLNLVVNALDSLSAVAERPRILHIRTGRDGAGEARVSVQDTGAGIDQEQSERLFLPFFTTKPHGLGMGLAISRSIVEAHGGRLWMTPNDGPGVTFHFALPTQDGAAK